MALVCPLQILDHLGMGSEKRFEVLKGDRCGPRLGRLNCAHGVVETPIFMPVGTQGTVKGLVPDQLKAAGAQIILGNTYHLNLRPGSERIRELGGLHSFMGWDGPILTDSGGFQVFSLSKLRKIHEHGIHFKSHLDGKEVELTPRRVMEIQANLGSDIAMVLDECPEADAARNTIEQAVDRTVRWAAEAAEWWREHEGPASSRMAFGIVQGGRFQDLREECADRLIDLEFPGYAIGGVSVGEAEEAMLPQVESSVKRLPKDKPRYVMGVGTPPQLLKMIQLGVDMFDCVMPTREARHGIAFTEEGKFNLNNSRFKDDPAPLMERFTDSPNGRFSRAYLRHLFNAGEMLGGILLSLHNIRFYLDLMQQARFHIQSGDFGQWHTDWIEKYTANSN